MYPPPTTTKWSNFSSISSASLLEITPSPYFMNGNSIGTLPFAKITFSASIWMSPTTTVFASLNSAQPVINSAPELFSRCSTPLFRRSTISSFHPFRAAISSSAGPGIEIPMCPPFFACFAKSWNL